ncbi:MAG TPA: hypothetical protein PK079_12875 [Leptospiraceae bacterium]|nr:hypothetical protein [Leptospiraceae bacterium]HMW04877.1 hypothetical protein [Leptospiraceae bacterium]HMX32560.1 hypothetical protein [Leptospiraceae bacterium]HMY30902.1 hypothetical protein [Leptospiraceae bacterium]HMZ62706.1 hypothetical protein [Leptospiraceae bacterium]
MKYFLLLLILFNYGYSPLSAKQKSHKNKSNCEIWIGKGRGSEDPNLSLELSICFHKNNVTGTAIWKSELGGTCKTTVSGFKNEKNTLFILKDLKFLEKSEKNGWQICLTDKYRFFANKNKMNGFYESKACQDYGSITLEKKF